MVHSEQYTRSRRDALSQLLLVTDLMRQDMRSGLEQRGLTQVRAHLLWELGERQPMTQRELADVLRVTPRNVTTLLDALEETGFISRAPHPTDRRAMLVSLTRSGTAARRQLQKDMDGLADLLFGEASAADLAAFSRLATRAAGRLAALAKDS